MTWQPISKSLMTDGGRVIFGVDLEDDTKLAVWQEGRGDPAPLASPVHVLPVWVNGRERVMFIGDDLGHADVKRVMLDTPSEVGMMARFETNPRYYRSIWSSFPLMVEADCDRWDAIKPGVVKVRWQARRKLLLPGWRTVDEHEVRVSEPEGSTAQPQAD